MRITVHSAPTQQRFAIALTLTDRWLTTKTAADVVRLFLKRFDAKHGSKTTDEFKLAVRNGDAIAPDQPLGAALGSSTDLELRRVESSEDALAQLRKLETMEEAAIHKAYRALARGEGDGLVRDLARVDATTLDAALQTFLEEDSARWALDRGNALQTFLEEDSTRWALAREVYRSNAFVRAVGMRRMPTGLPRRCEVLEPLGCTIAERSSWRRPPDDVKVDGVAALILEKAPERRKPCELTPLAFWAQNALQMNDVLLTREAVDELASYMRERLELRPVGFRPVAVEMGAPRLSRFLGRDVVEAGDAAMPDIIEAYRPTILLNCWNYGNAPWLTQLKGTVPDPDFPCDVPEFVLIGPTAELMPLVKATALRLKRDAPPDKKDKWEAFEGYDAYHIERVSRKLLHVADDADRYGHACCVSFRAADCRLSQFRTRAEVAHSKAQGVVARAYANAQRGVVGTPDDLRELDEAQRVVRSTDRAVRDGVRQPLRTV